jgi:hypothetical protein
MTHPARPEGDAPLPNGFEARIGRWRRDEHPTEWAAAAETLAAMLMERRGAARAPAW